MKPKNYNLRLLCLTLLLMIGASGLYAVDPTDVTVNGVEVADGAPPAAGWSYDASTSKLTINEAGSFTISGKNTKGEVCVVVTEGVTTAITLSNLTLRAPWSVDNVCVFALETNANVSLFLAGENILESASYRAGLEVPTGATLTITHSPGDSEGALYVYGGYQAAGIGSGRNSAAGAITINGGAVAVQGGSYGAGIGGGSGYQSTAGSLTVNGGEVVAIGGSGGAGIGGGANRSGGTVNITGGSVTAEGGYYGAGIGGGGSYNSGSGDGGTVTISGGRVAAYGNYYAAGIGGGGNSSTGGNGGTVRISGGTVIARGDRGGADIGPGKNNNNGSENTFTGGSICLAASSALPAPTNNTTPVGCAVLSGFEANAAVTITGLSGYGVNDIFADNYGSIYLWLPDGNYTFDANEQNRTVKIQGGVGPTNVTVNGDDVAFGPTGGATWNFDANTHILTLSGEGPFTLSGGNATGAVCVVVPADFNKTITLSNLTLLSAGNNQCAFALEENANISLLLAGNNRLGSGENRAGIEVATGQTLSINNVSGDEAATLTVTGGNYGAGIGGGKNATAGTITIAGGAITANGGSYGAGVGGGYKGAGGNVSVSGGSLTATGGYYSTGIGGGGGGDSYNSVGGAGGSLTISGGIVVATGDRSAAGVGGGNRGAGGTVNITGGSLTATGGKDGGAGIGNGPNYSGTDGTVTISGGQVTATGGNSGAGIGGSDGSTGSAVTISGGNVVAQSNSGAGIGGGYNATNNTVTISGGKVIAQSNGGAGIGGGYKGAGGTVAISGGTVFAQSKDGADIGSGMNGAVAGTNTFTGGSIRLANSFITSAPTNGTNTVGCAVVTGFVPDEAVAITNLAGYGVNDIVADETGAIFLWLPDGTHTFTANGSECTVKLQDGVGNTGVFVNGKEVAFGPDSPAEGWSYEASTFTLKLIGAGPFTLSGSSLNGSVRVVIPEGVSKQITLSNLTLSATGSNQCAFTLDTLAVVSLFLEGTNKLTSGSNRAGLEVAAGRTITINHASGDITGSLTATSGYNAAGIGGGLKADAGTININGGVVNALGGGYFSSGIGGGNNAGTGTINISGGTVTAVGGGYAAGIGTGGYAVESGHNVGTVTISGGTVTATGGELSAGIGGGDTDPGGTVIISGGRVTATGGRGAAGIGGGGHYKYTAGEGATLSISGGTVFAIGGEGGGPGIGGGVNAADYGGTTPNVSGTSTFTGGSIRVDNGYAANDPTDGTNRVWCVTVPELTPNAAINVTSLDTYGVKDLFADNNGKLYLWLPNDDYNFTAGDADYEATVAGANTTATLSSPPAPIFTGSGDWSNANRWSTGAVPGTTQKVIIDGDATISNDLETAGFVINPGKSITVNAGKKLTINSQSTNNGTIHLLSDAANGTATLVGDVAGQAIVKQAAVNYRTYYLSSPVSGTVTTSNNMGQSITFTESTDKWTSPIPFAGVNPVQGKGYGVQVGADVAVNERGTATTLSFTGILNNGEVKIPITSGNKQFNFLGNPYPSYLNTIEVVADPNITSSLWFYSKIANNTPYQFTAYNVPTGLSIPDAGHDYGYIPPMQGFWVKANADVDFTFSNDMRVHKPTGSPATFRAPQAAERQLMRLQITNGTEKDETVILFSEEATGDWNSSKPMNPRLTIYTVKAGEKLALNSRTAIEYDVETPVGVKAAKGEYTFSAIKYDNFGTDKVFLLDKVANVTTELSNGNSYIINFAEAYEGTDRFALVFPHSGVITGWDGAAQTHFFAFAKDKRIIVNSDAQSGTIYVYNSVGQQLAAEPISGKLTTVSTVLQEGVYVVKLNNQTTKVVVK